MPSVQQLFGEDLERPNIPLVNLVVHETQPQAAITWGRELCIISTATWTILYRDLRERQDDPYVHVACSDHYWLGMTHNKQLHLLDIVSSTAVSYSRTFHLKRRVTAVAFPNPTARGPETPLLIADKFGDLYTVTIAELASMSDATVAMALRHMARNPADKTFAELRAAELINNQTADSTKEESVHSPAASEEGRDQREGGEEEQRSVDGAAGKSGRTWTHRETPEEQDEALRTAWNGHLATITQMKMLSFETQSGQSIPMVVSLDRDEKVRVSRYPELWILEAIMCGHTEFVVDVVKIGPTMILTAGADRSLRGFDVSSATNVSSFFCSKVPMSLTKLSNDLVLVGQCGTEEVEVVDSRCRLESWRLPNVPCAFAALGDDFLWVDIDRELRLGREGRIMVDNSLLWETPAADSLPLSVRHWKHNRESGVPSNEERRAKRLRHKERGNGQSHGRAGLK